MIGSGTAVNVAAIVSGAALGLCIRKGIPARWQETILQVIGLSVCIIGLKMALQTESFVIVIISLVCGAIIGEKFCIEEKLDKFGEWVGGMISIRQGANENKKSIGQGFIYASLIYCVGAMAIVGSLQEGLTGDASTLYAKSILDGITAIIFAANMGIGVALAAVSVGIYQGALTLLAGFLESRLSEAVMRELTATGGVLIISIGINMLKFAEIRIANLLPAILVVIFVVECAKLIK